MNLSIISGEGKEIEQEVSLFIKSIENVECLLERPCEKSLSNEDKKYS